MAHHQAFAAEPVNRTHHHKGEGKAHHALGRDSPAAHKPAGVVGDQAVQMAVMVQFPGQVEGMPATPHHQRDPHWRLLAHGLPLIGVLASKSGAEAEARSHSRIVRSRAA